MKVKERPSLREMNTFGVSAQAALLVEVNDEEDVLSMPSYDPARDFVLGGGSNVLFVDDVPGTVFLNRIKGIEIIESDKEHALIEVGAGENWHRLVTWSVQQGLFGLENLAMIPGLAGAAPIQNIGAYGVELSSVLEFVCAWDWQTSSWVVLSNEQCGFRYRDSIFRSTSAERYFITSIRLRLARRFRPRLDYGGLKETLAGAGVAHPAATDVMMAVIRLRQKKLPDPAVEGNAGSFFKNPVVSSERIRSLLERFPDMPVWKVSEREAKVSAAWMIERCGLKGRQHMEAAVSMRHALVLVNQGRARGIAIWQLAEQVQDQVRQQFGVELEPEPRIYRANG